ncbi:MAG: regulatory protein RecX [Bacteroidales bacterium]|nr:regulatory protein RecX [Bacteroidales bacterium]MDD3201461.1 regulatory protein RecX [Bacteroidales bacterium]
MEYELILAKMMRLCSMSEHCKSDVLKKVESLDASDAAKVIDTLCENDFINEHRYAKAFARDKSSLQGWGEMKIRVALSQKKIAPEVITEAISSIDSEAARKKLTSLMLAKMKALSGEGDEQIKKVKLFRYLTGRGYNYDLIKQIYDNIRSN